MWKEKIKHGKEKKKERKRKENAHRKGKKKNRHIILLLSVEDKQEILKLTFNTINCLMKHNNLSCQFWGNLVQKKMRSGEIFRAQTFSAPLEGGK